MDSIAVDVTFEDIPDRLRQVCRSMGLEASIKLFEQLGGRYIYVPQAKKLLRPLTLQRMRAEFNGTNYEALCLKYGYTMRWVRHILHSMERDGPDGVITMKDVPPSYRQVCRAIGIEAAIKLSQAFGGAQLQIPKIPDAIRRKQIYARVRVEYDGTNLAALARKYGYTQRWIREILKGEVSNEQAVK